MFNSIEKFWQNIYLRAILFTLIVIVIVWILGKTQLAWVSFLIAFLVAYLVNPFLTWLERKRIPRSLGVLIVMIGLVLLGFMVVVLLSSLLIALSDLPVYVGQTISRLPDWLESSSPAWLKNLISDNQTSLNNFLDNMLRNIVSWTESNIDNIVNQIISGTSSFFAGVLNVFILIIFIAFTIAGYPVIAKALVELFPEHKQSFAKDLGQKLDIAVGGYLRAKLLESTIMFVVSSTVLYLLGVPNALALGLVNALLNPIPYVGPLISTAIESLVALTVSWQLALIVLVAMFIIEQIDGNIIAPILLSKGVNVHPILILSSVIVGSALFGFRGILLAVPATAFLQLLYNDYYKTSEWYTQKVTPTT